MDGVLIVVVFFSVSSVDVMLNFMLDTKIIIIFRLRYAHKMKNTYEF